MFLPVVDKRLNSGKARTDFEPGADRKSKVPQPAEGRNVTVLLVPFGASQLKTPHRKPPARCFARIEQPDGARSGVPWVGEFPFAGSPALTVESLEHAPCDIDLAANFHQRRQARDFEWQLPNRPGICRHIVAHGAVTTGNSPYELAILVEQRDGNAIDLELRCERTRLTPEFAADSTEPGLQLLPGIAVVE